MSWQKADMVNTFRKSQNNPFIKVLACVAMTAGCLFSAGTAAQSKVEIFADLQGNDTLQKLVTLFTRQLKKTITIDFIVKSTSEYTGKGIYLGLTTASYQPVKPSSKLLQSGVEAFSGKATTNTVQVLGNSNMGIGHGIFTYLDQLGFRFYFPNPDWHIIPRQPNLFQKWSIVSRPSFDHRRIWYGYGTGSKIADDDYFFWVLSNRLGGSVNPSFGHSYEGIISNNREAFLQHPEWFYPPAPAGTIPDNEPKFDITREDLIQLIIRDFEKRIEASIKNKTNDYKMLSLAPSDGTGVCNSPACQKLGTPTDRVYYLVNRVAKAIRQKYPSTYIGCLAYSEYIAPPAKKIEPNVFVGITNGFNTSKFPIEQLVDEWKKKAAFIGIYDYFSWYAWDFDIPGMSQASRPADILRSLKKYYDKGVRAYEGESSIGWISKGLGYYLVARSMWDIKTDAEPVRNEFFQLCFGKAADEIKKLWQEWESYSFTFVRENDLAKWIDRTDEASRLEQSPGVKKRLFQVRSYLHYLSLYHEYESDKTEKKLLPLLNYGYRKLDDGSVAGYPAFFELGNRSGNPAMGYVENAKWKYNNNPVTTAEMDRLMTEDRKKLATNDPVKTFTATTKFKNVPDFRRFGSLMKDSTGLDNSYWMLSELVMEIKKKGNFNYFDFRGDFTNETSERKPIRVSVYPYTADGNVSSLTPVLIYEYKAKHVQERVDLSKLEAGYYTVLIEDPTKIFTIRFNQPINYSIVLRPARQLLAPSFFYSFFYVPEGTKKFNIIKAGSLELVTASGRELIFAKDKGEDLQVDVQKGEAGLWRIRMVTGRLFIEGVPPYIGPSPSQMLIPADIK